MYYPCKYQLLKFCIWHVTHFMIHSVKAVINFFQDQTHFKRSQIYEAQKLILSFATVAYCINRKGLYYIGLFNTALHCVLCSSWGVFFPSNLCGKELRSSLSLRSRVFQKNTFLKEKVVHTLTTPYRAYINHTQKIHLARPRVGWVKIYIVKVLHFWPSGGTF